MDPEVATNPKDGKNREVEVTKASSLQKSTGQTEGIIRQGAVIDQADKLCASAKPRTFSAVHHHGEQDTVVYCLRGSGAVLTDFGKTRHDLSPGDFALIPAWKEHQEVNDSDEESTFIVTRSGRIPIVQNLEGWGTWQKMESGNHSTSPVAHGTPVTGYQVM
ncbi:MAG: hypothetical protein Q9183_001585 [Haloplaca sp. 2 TL-2023]